MRALFVAAVVAAALGTVAPQAMAKCDDPAGVQCTTDCLVPRVVVTSHGVEIHRYYC
jgi:hypothetical protein